MLRNADIVAVREIARDVIRLCNDTLSEPGDIQRKNLDTVRKVTPHPDH